MDIDDIDRSEFLAALEALAQEAGDWRQHLPYEAAVQYHRNPRVAAKFGEHVETCAWCKELIALYGR